MLISATVIPAFIRVIQKKERFNAKSCALGRWIRIGDRRFRVIGVLGRRGQSLGMDLSEIAIIPVASAQALFNSPALFRVLVQAPSKAALNNLKKSYGLTFHCFMHPSSKKYCLSIFCARAGEWVTTISVVFFSLFSFNIKSSKTPDVFASREPVGSSASKMSGEFISALTTATLWDWPMES